jgi:hypothetical protein
MAFTRVGHSVQAIGDIAFTPIQDGSTMTAMTVPQLGMLVALADMSGNGQIMTMTSCMMKNWVVNTDYPTGVDVQGAYEPCFDIAVKCANTASCYDASSDVKTCAKDKDVTLVQNSVFTNVWEPASTASHDDWCIVAGCAAEAGDSLFMSVGTCKMDALGMSYNKCYDDMMGKIKMLAILVGGVSFVTGVLLFTGGWCLCCRGSGKESNPV